MARVMALGLGVWRRSRASASHAASVGKGDSGRGSGRRDSVSKGSRLVMEEGIRGGGAVDSGRGVRDRDGPWKGAR